MAPQAWPDDSWIQVKEATWFDWWRQRHAQSSVPRDEDGRPDGECEEENQAVGGMKMFNTDGIEFE